MAREKLSGAARLTLAVEIIIGACGLFYAAALAIFVGAYAVAIIIAVLSLLLVFYLADSDTGVRRRIIAGLVIIAAIIYTAMFPCSFKTDDSRRYSFERSYIINRQNIGDINFFPEFLPDTAEDFYSEYSPSILQGTGHYGISFRTDESTLEEYTRYGEENAVFTCTLEEYLGSDNGKRMSKEQYDSLLELSGSSSASLSIFADDTMKSDAENVMVYVLYSNFDWNHPESSAVLINLQQKTVQFSRMG